MKAPFIEFGSGQIRINDQIMSTFPGDLVTTTASTATSINYAGQSQLIADGKLDAAETGQTGDYHLEDRTRYRIQDTESIQSLWSNGAWTETGHNFTVDHEAHDAQAFNQTVNLPRNSDPIITNNPDGSTSSQIIRLGEDQSTVTSGGGYDYHLTQSGSPTDFVFSLNHTSQSQSGKHDTGTWQAADGSSGATYDNLGSETKNSRANLSGRVQNGSVYYIGIDVYQTRNTSTNNTGSGFALGSTTSSHTVGSTQTTESRGGNSGSWYGSKLESGNSTTNYTTVSGTMGQPFSGMTQTGFNMTTMYGTSKQTGPSGMYGSYGQTGTGGTYNTLSTGSNITPPEPLDLPPMGWKPDYTTPGGQNLRGFVTPVLSAAPTDYYRPTQLRYWGNLAWGGVTGAGEGVYETFYAPTVNAIDRGYKGYTLCRQTGDGVLGSLYGGVGLGLADLTGVSDLEAGINGRELFTNRQLSTTERIIQGGSGSVQIIFTAVGAKSLLPNPRQFISCNSVLNRPMFGIGDVACFPKGTLIHTSFGPHPIDQIKIGDKVLAFDLVSGKWVASPVINTFQSDYHGFKTTIRCGGESIESTANHPFWVISGEDLENRPLPEVMLDLPEQVSLAGRWVDAGLVRVGDQLHLVDGTQVRVEKITNTPISEKVFNLEINEIHTYAVGKNGILVHNSNKCTKRAGNAIGGVAPNNPLQAAMDRGMMIISGPNAPNEMAGVLDKLGKRMSRDQIREAIHSAKRKMNIGAAEDLIFDKSGGMWDSRTGEYIGKMWDAL